MEFFGRVEEVASLRRIREKAFEAARMTVLTGRRRVGKTALVRQALDETDRRKIDLDALRLKSVAFFTKNPERSTCSKDYRGLSLGDM